jgi:hypothetical protein
LLVAKEFEPNETFHMPLALFFLIEIPVCFASCSNTFSRMLRREYYDVLGRDTMDGNHVMLKAPWNSFTEYYYYKNFFSIVLFALVEANYNFMYVDVGCQGRISDGGVFKNTNMYNKLERKTLNIPAPSIL